MKKVLFLILGLFLLNSQIFLNAKSPEYKIRYLMANRYSRMFCVYDGNDFVTSLSELMDRTIYLLRFDDENPDYLLFVEETEKQHKLIRLNIHTSKEEILFSYKPDSKFKFCEYTKECFYYAKQDALYEYNSRTKKLKLIYELPVQYNKKNEELYGEIGLIRATDDKIFINAKSFSFSYKPMNYIIDRKTGEVKEAGKGYVEINKEGLVVLYPICIKEKNKIATLTFSYETKSYRFSNDKFTFINLNNNEEYTCSIFPKEYDQGPVVLIDDNLILIPLRVAQFLDFFRNGLFKNDHTIQCLVYDIKKDKTVYKGYKYVDNILWFQDAIILK